MDSIKSLFKVILDGDRKASTAAAREVRKFLYSSRGENQKYKDIVNELSKVQENYEQIVETWRLENYVVAISVIYFLRDKKSRPDFLFSWFYKLLLHENGLIRYAAVRMFGTEFGPLTVHVRFPDRIKFVSNYNEIIRNDSIILDVYNKLFDLSESLLKPLHKRYKYLDSLPVGPYKSVQMVIANLLDLCDEDYIINLEHRYSTMN